MARPKKPTDEARRHIITFRLTNAEMDQLEKESVASGTVPNECARLKTTGGPAPGARKKVRAERPRLEVSFDLRQELRRVGVNMNQIARRLNMIGEHEPAELVSATRRVDEILAKILTGLAAGA